MGRKCFHIPQEELYFMTYGKWKDIFDSYKFINNFQAKRALYADAEEETKKYQDEHRPVDNDIMNL